MKIDRGLLHLHDIIDAGEAILSFTREGREAFLENRMTRDAVLRNPTVIGEATKRLSAASGSSTRTFPGATSRASGTS